MLYDVITVIAIIPCIKDNLYLPRISVSSTKDRMDNVT